MASLLSLDLAGPGSPAVVLIGRNHKILFTNRAAAALFGLQGNGACAAPCYQVLRLRTRDGRPLCGADCRPWREAREGRPDLIQEARPARAPASPGLTVSTQPLARLRDGDPALLHVIAPGGVDLLWPLSDRRATPASRRLRGLRNLSPREREVLELLASGLGTVKVARRLLLSPITVRHHVQGILATLRVHRRLDAVLAWVENQGRG